MIRCRIEVVADLDGGPMKPVFETTEPVHLETAKEADNLAKLALEMVTALYTPSVDDARGLEDGNEIGFEVRVIEVDSTGRERRLLVAYQS